MDAAERRFCGVVVRTSVAIGVAAALTAASAQAPPDRCLVPARVRDAILGEYSGEQVRLHVQMLAANRNRDGAEYAGRYFETDSSARKLGARA
jgi:hypothetical protein